MAGTLDYQSDDSLDDGSFEDDFEFEDDFGEVEQQEVKPGQLRYKSSPSPPASEEDEEEGDIEQEVKPGELRYKDSPNEAGEGNAKSFTEMTQEELTETAESEIERLRELDFEGELDIRRR